MSDQKVSFHTNREKNWLRELLREQNVEIEFLKRDGTLRKMICTLKTETIPEEKTPKGTGKAKNDDSLAVFDVEKSEWRSFRWDSLQSVNFKVY